MLGLILGCLTSLQPFEASIMGNLPLDSSFDFEECSLNVANLNRLTFRANYRIQYCEGNKCYRFVDGFGEDGEVVGEVLLSKKCNILAMELWVEPGDSEMEHYLPKIYTHFSNHLTGVLVRDFPEVCK